MRPLTSQTSPQAGRATVTRLLPLFFSVSLSPRASTPIPLLHVRSHSPPNHSRQADLLSAGAWINIVDGTNIVNLLEEWSRLNSISADNAVGQRRSETVPLCWKSSVLERLLALTKGRCRVLPSLMSKCRLKSDCRGFSSQCFFYLLKKEKSIHQMELETTGLLLIDLIPDLSSLGLLYTPLAFVKAILSHFLYCM